MTSQIPTNSDPNLFNSLTPAPLLNKPSLESLGELRTRALEQIRAGLRPGQQQMADWRGGPLAVSAVPGAGKSTGMAGAAAIAIARYQLHSSRQLVVVTFTRSAAANIKAKIRQALRTMSLPQGGFLVQTLHGLALNIATRHPELSGLNLERLTLISPTQSHRLIRACIEQWIADHPALYQRLLEGQHFDGEETERLRRQSVLRTEVLPELAQTVIHEAKSSGLLPQDLQRLSTEITSDEYSVLEVAAGLYERYQALLRSRDFIDYDEMILSALRVLDNDSARQLWQTQTFAVFEDEAQDSTPLQTKLLEILSTNPSDAEQLPNLVRVGDPNQAINSTFTPADPIFFRDFCENCSTQDRLVTMDQAGRSTQVIIDAANFVLAWVNRTYGAPRSQTSLAANSTTLPFRPQHIRPVDPEDPQPDANPTPTGRGLELYTPRDTYHTVELIGQRVIELFAQDPQTQAAILVRENKQGRFIAERLSYLKPDYGIEVYDVGDRDRHSRVPGEILALLQFIDRPHSPDNLKAALTVLVERQLIPSQDLNAIASLPEQFLYPGPLDPPQSDPVQKARRFCTSLLRARLELPHYQFISFLALALNYDQAELATADKLAERIAQQTVGDSSMTAMLMRLSEIVSSEKFEPVETENSEARYTRSGQLTIITMHKAKGLDWDYVFLPFLHEQTIPGGLRILPQSQFLGDFTLSEVARAQIRASLHGQFPLPDVATAWERAGHLKLAEEFRLLYVAMTRAKRLLWMSAAQKAPFTWSKPNNLEDKKPCPVLPALKRQFPEAVVPL
ncbi:ATP-dependent helicase [Trichocoleus sp. FACHB-262]|uniref:ATP-dependent helicase n=1 Tax=Trichocoleus sp. FACHB-262 TaxID=2692869 RepID=UPI0016840850|nr:ATP-dependent helicase [Trichocoleus sp. FACHB-262]MBD2124413.1 ATP-dependent helicase [Trichocoleus sp. FACHB-262]